MSSNRKFIIGIVIFLVLVFIAELNMPEKFVWNPTFRHDDRQPFGSFVTDSLLRRSMPHGYTITDKTLYQLEHDSSDVKPNILLIDDYPEFSETDVASLRRMLTAGRKVLVVGLPFYDSPFCKEFGIRLSGRCYIIPTDFKKLVRTSGVNDSLDWTGSSHPRRRFRLYNELTDGEVLPIVASDTTYQSEADCEDDTDTERRKHLAELRAAADSLGLDTLMMDAGYDDYVYGIELEAAEHYGYRHPLQAVRIKVGKGELIVCSLPLLFTNYNVLDGGNGDLVFRLMSQIADRPVVKTEHYLNQGVEISQSPLSFFLERPPLRWAVYLSLVGVLLYMFFTARRRQRVIPVVKEPENRSLEFVRLIGTLYHQRHDNTDLVRKKYNYFAERIRRTTMIDIEDVADDGAELLAEYLGRPYEKVAALLAELRAAVSSEGNITDKQMRRCIDIMREIEASIQ